MAYAGENYPFRINIINKEGNKRAYFTSSLATDLDTVVSCSIMVNRINNMYSSSYRQDASGSDQNFSGLIDSISGGGNPWRSSTELGFLAAQEAGIFSAVSAGNGGPDPYTTAKSAPWYTVVGASTHGRTLDTSLSFNDADYVFINGTGPAISEIISATPIAAIDVDAANFIRVSSGSSLYCSQGNVSISPRDNNSS